MFGFRGLLAALPAVVLRDTFEPDGFDARRALHAHGFAVTDIQHSLTLNEASPCSVVCASLSSRYGGAYVFGSNTSHYDDFRQSYWSAIQREPRPQCVFEPPDADAVAALVLLSRMAQCPFAVKSGGHAAFVGASSIHGGIVVSLVHLNGIELSTDKKIVYVGPGNDWGRVYSTLAKDEITVVGGRVAGVGIGGLTLGGGMSFFSGSHGWACDNVEAFEVITASGRLVTATPDTHTDLYWALRGGGNNFGIVTRFHFRTISIPGNTIWAGTTTYTENAISDVLQAFTDLTFSAEQYPGAGQWVGIYQREDGSIAASVTSWFDSPTNITHEYDPFSNFSAIPNLYDDRKTRDIVEFVNEIQASNPPGRRVMYWTVTTKASMKLAGYAVDTFLSALPSISDVKGAFPVFDIQSITVPQMKKMAQNGGNALGLDSSTGPLFVLAVIASWEDAFDDDTIYSFASSVLDAITDRAREWELDHEYIYMNYASKFQDVIRGYGVHNKARLIEIAEKYDPQGVFQRLQPGHFKLHGT